MLNNGWILALSQKIESKFVGAS